VPLSRDKEIKEERRKKFRDEWVKNKIDLENVLCP